MKGGKIRVEERIRELIRLTGIVIPLSLALYSLFPWPEKPHAVEPSVALALVLIPWLLLGLVTYLSPARKTHNVILRLGLYHLCIGAYIVLVSGFSPPFIPLMWVLLLLVSYIYLSRRGLVFSFSTLVLTAAVDSSVAYSSSGDHVLPPIVTVAAIFLFGSVIVLLHRIQATDSRALAKSKAQETLQSDRMNTLINNMADAVITINEDGKVELFNAASLNLLNTNIGLHQQLIDDVIKVKDTSGKTIKLFQLAKKVKSVSVRDDLTLDIDDETIRLEVTASPVRSSYSESKSKRSTDGYILILRDVTKAKSLEEERDEFISVVSHELRTPITIAEGTLSNAQLMAERGKSPPGAIGRSLADAHDQILFLSRMVNDLSTLSRAERGVADVAEQIDVQNLIDNLYNEYAPQAKKKQLLFDVDVLGKLGTVTASQLYLRELLQNLITNAIKYTKEGSITLRATRKDTSIRFEVKDTGIGISKGDQAKIFHKFYRSEDYRTRETGGTGLGLYVAAKLAKKLGTTIEVKSRLNYGSTFSFVINADTDEET